MPETPRAIAPPPFAAQGSCIDCGFKHRPSKCPHRRGRKHDLQDTIRRLQRELDLLNAYDECIENGWTEHPTRYEEWEATRV